MFQRAVGLAAVCALTTNALVLPPGIASDNEDDHFAPSVLDPSKQRIEIPCSTCTFSAINDAIKDDIDDDLLWIQGGDNNKLVLDFSVSNDGQRLLLHGDAIYPPEFHQEAYLEGKPIYVDQVPASPSLDPASEEASAVPLEVTSSSLKIEKLPAISPSVHGGGNDAVVRVNFSIMGLENHPMDLEDVAIHLLRTSEGKLLILRLDTVPNANFIPLLPPPPPFPMPSIDMDGTADCNTLPPPLCKFKKMVEAKVEAMKQGRFSTSRPCPFPNSEATGMDMSGPPPPPPHAFLERPNAPPHHHHKHHSLAGGLIAILIPVVAGITVGLLVSLLGLLAGRLICWCWARFSKAVGLRSGSDRDVPQEMRRDAEEGKILLGEDDIEPLPLYEEAPPYEIHDSERR